MAARGVSVLKFVGTVSLGVLTGLSYTLTSLTIPALLTLPSAGSAARAFDILTTTASRHARSLAAGVLLGAAATAAQRRQREKRQREREQRAAAARARMEASYEVLGGFEAHSEGSAEEYEAEEAYVNGEQGQGSGGGVPPESRSCGARCLALGFPALRGGHLG
ncbi:predicted protein [Chaetomium globosum CBS 148.51]|uniref:Uncharacterized protein n=1 Tax=Chaetomium globosum (strain ATCC 6205 / CBS 148.51 / DSM 1962 / NBRC 6347 / NRRL 1970) TaxID=306901 RepID=Q2GZP4_CHAGB|nr:uncharacterized protein CHGG_05002 [Chaetomium globosum CBS 148.51]EAQ88383.1 predicted protein [Chaetomium globosum CBS 148.51]